MDLTKLFVGEMGIDLRGCDVCMAQQFLHGTDVCPVYQEIRCKAMAELVRVDVFRDAGLFRPFFNKALYRAA